MLVSFGRYAGFISVQMGSDQLSEDTVNTRYDFTCDFHVLGVTHATVSTHYSLDDVKFYNLPLDHSHSPPTTTDCSKAEANTQKDFLKIHKITRLIKSETNAVQMSR